MARRPRPSNSGERQDEWIWGNDRGGGGAPLKDARGNTITNLKVAVAQGDNYSGDRDRSPRDDDYYQPSNQRPRRQETNFLRSPSKYRDNDDYDETPSPRRQPPPVGGSPGKKFMSALQDMYSNPREKVEKQRREMEYQDQLRAQIEEKKRQREAEKAKEEDLKRREYDEYMNSVHANGPRKQSNPNSLRQADSDPPSTNANRPPRKPRRGDDEQEDEELDRRERMGRDPRDRARGPPGDRLRDDNSMRGGERGRQPDLYNDRDSQRRRPARDHSDDSDNRRGRRRGAGVDDADDIDEPGHMAGGRGSNAHGDKRYVSPEAYDELSSLCDRLLQQQEQLQAELHQQASIIKELQRANPAPPPARGGVAGNARQASAIAGRNNERAAPPMPPAPALRSKSVQQRRPEPISQAKKDVPALVQQRPSSMYQLSGGKEPPSKGQPPGAAAGKGDLRKPAKVAFGHPAVTKDSKDAAKKRAVPGLALNGEKAIQKVPPAASKPSGPVGRRGAGAGGDRGGGDDYGDEPGPGMGGFSKLQARVRGGPVIVSYDDEVGEGGGGGNGGGLELRGQSRYVPVRDSGDQLDRLLENNRKGKFH